MQVKKKKKKPWKFAKTFRIALFLYWDEVLNLSKSA